MRQRYRREISIALAIVTLWIAEACLASGFFTVENQRDLLMANMPRTEIPHDCHVNILAY